MSAAAVRASPNRLSYGFGVWCVPSYSVRFGYREARWLKKHDEEVIFSSMNEAEAEAMTLNAGPGAAYATYFAKER